MGLDKKPSAPINVKQNESWNTFLLKLKLTHRSMGACGGFILVCSGF
jgi:hypothetical protein